MIVVHECQPAGEISLDSGLFGYVPKRTILLVVQEQNPAVGTDRQVGESIIVIVPGSATGRVHSGINPGPLCSVFELAVAQVVIKRHPALHTVIGYEDIDLAVVVIVEQTGTRPGLK